MSAPRIVFERSAGTFQLPTVSLEIRTEPDRNHMGADVSQEQREQLWPQVYRVSLQDGRGLHCVFAEVEQLAHLFRGAISALERE